MISQDYCYNKKKVPAGAAAPMVWIERLENNMHISMDTLERICEMLNCEITDVIELVPDEPASTEGKEHERIEAYPTNGMDAAFQ